MKNIRQTIFFFIYVLSFLSIALSDPAEAITSLVGRNAEGYLAPLGTMMGSGMNSGFYRKASPHKILGFDFTLDVVYSMAPAGNTTYTFYVPDGPGDTISFPFQFEFPKGLLTNDNEYLAAIPTAGTSNSGEDLYQDISLPFSLKITDLLDVKEGTDAQNILGKDEPILLTVTLDSALLNISDQALTHTWNTAEGIPGIGTEYVVTEPSTGLTLTTLEPLYDSKEEFKEKYGAPLDSLIRSQLGQIEMPTLPIPGGFGDDFNGEFLSTCFLFTLLDNSSRASKSFPQIVELFNLKYITIYDEYLKFLSGSAFQKKIPKGVFCLCKSPTQFLRKTVRANFFLCCRKIFGNNFLFH